MINEALRLLRVFNDIKASELAKQLDISPNYLSEIEKGKKTPSLTVINKYGEIFDIKPSSILFFSEELNTKDKYNILPRKWIAKKLILFLQTIEKVDNEKL